SISKINNFYQNRVMIHGNVKKAGIYELKNGMKVKDLILLADSLEEQTFSKGFIYRILLNKKKEILSFDPNRAMTEDPKDNLLLENEDSLVVYRAGEFDSTKYVQIAGQVRRPGRYLRTENLTLSDLIVMAGGMTKQASYDSIEISRIDTTKINNFTKTKLVSITPDYWKNIEGQTYKLEDLDFVFIPRNPKIGEIKIVGIWGMVKFPGYYTLTNNQDRIATIINRAGGLREGAYLEASTYFRVGKGAGRVPIDMKRAVENPESPDNLLVNGGDSIFVSLKDDIVYVKGEVYVPNPVVYKPGASIDYYIGQAGGYNEEANESGTSAFLPTGKKWQPSWFIFPNPDIIPGSVIYVPKKIERPSDTLPLIRDIVTILASLAAITVSVVAISKR
ncbi:MAG: SLBB domain-containing protein, partial [Bacteroidota bacterium]|nr:SLBB domain-containing protein [Bacteroidota bacterium]